jgi:uncharacterized protein (AIM24 family)
MAPGQSVLLSGSTAGFLYAHPDVHVMSFMRQYVDDSSISKDDLYTNSGREPLLYLGAAAPHTGKILPVPVGGERMPLLVQDDCYLASTGLVNHKQVFLKTGEGLLQMTRIVPRPYTEYETRRSVRGRPATATVFVQSPGSIMETSLGPNESLHVYTSAIVALTEGVTLNPPWVNPAGYGEKKMKDGCLVRGPGTLYISGLPFSKQARRLLDTSPPEPDRYSSVRWFLTVVGAFFLSLVIYQLVFKQTGR